MTNRVLRGWFGGGNGRLGEWAMGGRKFGFVSSKKCWRVLSEELDWRALEGFLVVKIGFGWLRFVGEERSAAAMERGRVLRGLREDRGRKEEPEMEADLRGSRGRRKKIRGEGISWGGGGGCDLAQGK